MVGLGVLHHVVAWDLPGYGNSERLASPVTFAALGDAVARFADVIGAERVHLVGLSFGGMIAQYVAAWHADRVATLTLMATSPKFGLDGTSPEEWRSARLVPLDAGIEPIEFAPRVLAAIAGPQITSEALGGQVRAAANVSGAALRTSIDVLIEHDSRDILGLVTAPTQCLVGELDTETPVEYASAIAQRIPRARLHVVAGAGHLLNVEAPEVVNELLDNFFREGMSGRPRIGARR